MHSAGSITALLADDHVEFREMLKQFLESKHVKVIGEANDGAEAIRMSRLLHPDLVLMDISMPHLDGFSAAGRIKAEREETAVVMVTMYSDSRYRQEADAIGVDGFLSKDSLAEKLPQLLEDLSTELREKRRKRIGELRDKREQ